MRLVVAAAGVGRRQGGTLRRSTNGPEPFSSYFYASWWVTLLNTWFFLSLPRPRPLECKETVTSATMQDTLVTDHLVLSWSWQHNSSCFCLPKILSVYCLLIFFPLHSFFPQTNSAHIKDAGFRTEFFNMSRGGWSGPPSTRHHKRKTTKKNVQFLQLFEHWTVRGGAPGVPQ